MEGNKAYLIDISYQLNYKIREINQYIIILFHPGDQLVTILQPNSGMERNRRSALVDHFGRFRRLAGVRITRSKDLMTEQPEINVFRRSALVDHFGRF